MTVKKSASDKTSRCSLGRCKLGLAAGGHGAEEPWPLERLRSGAGPRGAEAAGVLFRSFWGLRLGSWERCARSFAPCFSQAATTAGAPGARGASGSKNRKPRASLLRRGKERRTPSPEMCRTLQNLVPGPSALSVECRRFGSHCTTTAATLPSTSCQKRLSR